MRVRDAATFAAGLDGVTAAFIRYLCACWRRVRAHPQDFEDLTQSFYERLLSVVGREAFDAAMDAIARDGIAAALAAPSGKPIDSAIKTIKSRAWKAGRRAAANTAADTTAADTTADRGRLAIDLLDLLDYHLDRRERSAIRVDLGEAHPADIAASLPDFREPGRTGVSLRSFQMIRARAREKLGAVLEEG